MAEISITTKLEELKVLFNQMKEVYYVSKVNSDLATLAAFDMELPVLSDGVTFDTGAADVSKIKLTTGATWTSIANAGDSDIQFQVPSVAGKINDLLLNKKAETVTMTATIDGETYEGEGYNIEPKKVIGGLFMRSEDRQTALFLPNVEGYSNFVSEQDKPVMKYRVTIKSGCNPSTGETLLTNEQATFSYIDYLGRDAEAEFPKPEVTVGGGKLLVHWYQVNEKGQPVNAQGTVVESPALAHQVQPAEYHSVNGSTGLLYNTPYTVDHKIFDGYTYYGSYILNDGSLTEGDSATVTLTAMPELSLVNPLIENDTHLGIIVSADSLDAAADLAVQQMVDLLASRTNETEADLVMLLSLVADVEVCQMVDPQKTVRFMVPKYVLDSIGFKL